MALLLFSRRGERVSQVGYRRSLRLSRRSPISPRQSVCRRRLEETPWRSARQNLICLDCRRFDWSCLTRKCAPLFLSCTGCARAEYVAMTASYAAELDLSLKCDARNLM